MRLLDLFCGAGGAARGYNSAGFTEIVGVDIEPQPDYPYQFVQADALNPPVTLARFDLIHASPPCQAYSAITKDKDAHPDLVAATRSMLDSAGVPYVIENVERSPVMGHLKLCGSMFGLEIQRHRLFELSGFAAMAPGGCNHKGWTGGRPWTITGALHSTRQDYPHSMKPASIEAARLMGMPEGMPVLAYTEAIPPAYTEWIGAQFLTYLTFRTRKV